MTNKTLTGLEAIELMKRGKLITNGHLVYKYEDGIVKCVSIMLLKSNQAEWCDHSVLSLNSKGYEEYTELNQSGWERVKKGEKYYAIDTFATVATDIEVGHSIEDNCYSNANYFSTKEKAEEINFKQTLFRKLQRFSDENGGGEIEWADTERYKYSIAYNAPANQIHVKSYYSTRDFGNVYFASREVAQQAIELFHDDLIKYFTM